MARFLAVFALGSVALAEVLALTADAKAQTQKLSGPEAALKAENLPGGGLAALPPLPSASTSTIFGGAIRKIDPVRDQFMLDVYGQRPMKVLFDERTQVYRDGVKIPLRELSAVDASVDHASVQTALDGTRIFAISIHILSQAPKGNYQGRVTSYDPETGELKLNAAPAPQPFTVLVPNSATFVRKGQSSFTSVSSGPADLVPGALVSVIFSTGAGAMGTASEIDVLAVPGSNFIFSGSLTALDLSGGTLVLVDPRDQRSYRIHFTPAAFPAAQNLHIGEQVRITASYDGAGYVATDITVY